jgi:hypothetical protein
MRQFQRWIVIAAMAVTVEAPGALAQVMVE